MSFEEAFEEAIAPVREIAKFGEEFCALYCIESAEELRERQDEFFRYIEERSKEQQ